MKQSLFISCLVLAALFAVTGCDRTSDPDHDDHDHQNEHDHEGHENHGHDDGEDHDHADRDDHDQVIALSPAQIDELGVEIAVAGPMVVEITTSLSGEIVMNPDTVAHVVARTTGIARSVSHTIGDTVAAGEALATLESPALARSKADYLARVREHELAIVDLNRAQTINENTQRLLEFLKSTPTLDALQEYADLDLGANRNALVSAYAQLVAAEAAYEREKSLFEDRIGAEADYLNAESTYKQAQAAFASVRDDLAFSSARMLDEQRRAAKVAEVDLRAAERKLHALGLTIDEIGTVSQQSDEQLSRYVVHAPIDGMIIDRHIVHGEQITEGSNVFTLADLSTVWAELTVYQRDLPVIKVGQNVRIVASHDVAQAPGVISYVSPVIDEATRSTTARVVLENPQRTWLPGLFVNASIQLDEDEADVVVPRDAVRILDGQPVIFIEHPDGFEPVNVTLGRGDPHRVIVLDGLDPGQRYAATNTFVLKSELGRAALEHAGHVH